MRATVDSAGRVVIPKAIRSRLGLAGGQEVEIIERDGTIEITPTVAMHLQRGGKGVVAVADRPMQPLTDDIVRDTLEQVRR